MAGEIVPYRASGAPASAGAALAEPAWRETEAWPPAARRPARIVFRSPERRAGPSSAAAGAALAALFLMLMCAVLALATALRLAAGRRRT